jgi:uncharacterized oxidoreductase
MEREEELDGEEGIAGRLLVHQIRERRGVLDAAVERVADERRELCARDRTEHEVGDARARPPHRVQGQHERVRRSHLVVAVRADHEQVAHLGVGQELLEVPATDLAALTSEIDINVNGTIRTTSALIDVIRANKGTIINVSSALAFVPLTSAPIYCATKAAIHSYTTSLRFQLHDAGVHVVELMPPAVKTDLAAELSEADGIKLITTDELVAATIKALEAGKVEIRPGQSNQLHWMSRVAPEFINGLLYKASKPLIPAG